MPHPSLVKSFSRGIVVVAATITAATAGPASSQAAPDGRASSGGSAGAAASSCAPTLGGVVATLGRWVDRWRVDRPATYAAAADDHQIYRVPGTWAGFGRTTSGPAAVPLVVRIRPRDGRPSTAALCRGRQVIARLPPLVHGARLVGASANGDRIAWRTWSPGRRGVVRVGRVAAGAVVGVRAARIPAVSRVHAVDGRIAVMPDGTAAWIAPDGAGRGTWLWPAHRGPRHVSWATRRSSSGVTIVDSRHIDDGTDLARYGPTTPGRCPTPYGTTATPFGPYRLTSTGVAEVGDGFAGDALITSLAVVCDPRAGDYVTRWADTLAGGRPDGGTGTSSIAAYETAGVAMHLRVSGAGGFGGGGVKTQLRTPDGRFFLVPGDLAAPGRTPSPFSFVGTSVVPGAVAWVSPAPAGDASRSDAAPRAVWLADHAGARIVGHVPAGAPADLRLGLSDQAVSWIDTNGPHTAPVTPAPQSPVTVVPTSR